MDSMNTIVAKNMKQLREENELSMDELAKLSGVSKSMLAQIERGDGNPNGDLPCIIWNWTGRVIGSRNLRPIPKADTVHSYKNIGDEQVILHMILYNP